MSTEASSNLCFYCIYLWKSYFLGDRA